MIQITYEGVDITKSVSIYTCYHDMYACDKADSAHVVVNDVTGIWDQWAPKNGDEMSITYGPIGTGKMYVYECKPRNGLFDIKITAAPPTYREKGNKAWQKVRLLQMGEEIAGRHGMTFESYDVEDQLYGYILQSNQDDFSFLNFRAALEGCALIMCDNKLIMYNEFLYERLGPSEFLNLSTNVEFDYRDNTNDGYGSCLVERGGYTGTYDAGNGLSAVLKPKDWFCVGSNAEAERFAKNLLRRANKNNITGYFKGYVMPGYAAGSCAVIKNAKVESWNGQVFLHHIRNDYANCESKMFFRRPLEGY